MRPEKEKEFKEILARIAARDEGLIEIDLNNFRLNDVDVLLLIQVLPQSKITSINLGSNHIKTEAITALAAALPQSQVTSLGLHGNNIDDAGAAALATGLLQSQVTSLDLGHNKIGVAGAAALAAVLPAIQITNISLEWNVILGAGAAALAKALASPQSKVTSLNLRRNYIWAEGAAALAKVLLQSQVTNLDLSLNDIEDTGAGALAEVLAQSQISSLNLGYNKIGDAGVVALAKVLPQSQVTSLDLSSEKGMGGNRIRADGLAALAKALASPQNKVTSINLRGSFMRSKDVTALLQVLAQSKVTSLDLSSQCGFGSIDALAEVLPQSQVASLILRDNSIGDDGVITLVKGLAQSQVTRLDLQENHIGEIGAAALAQVLAQSNITILDLEHNNIGDAGAGALAKAFVLPQSQVTSLSFKRNNIGDEGAIVLAKGLAQSKITSLNLEDNGIGEAGAAALVQVLAQSQVINLNLGQNKIGRAVVAALLSTLKANCRLTKISGLELDKEQRTILEEHLAINKLLTVSGHKGKKDESLRLLHSTIKQNSSSSNTQQPKDFPILKLFVAPELPFGINVEDIKQCFSEIKDDLEQLNSWLLRVPEGSALHSIVSDLILEKIKQQQLVGQEDERYFSSRLNELEKQLESLVRPNSFENHKIIARKGLADLFNAGKDVDELRNFLDSCEEPGILAFKLAKDQSYTTPTAEENFWLKMRQNGKEKDINNQLTIKIKEFTKVINKSQALTAYSLICSHLVALKKVYETYANEFSTAISKPYSSERASKIIELLEPAYILSMRLGFGYLKEAPCGRLTPSKGETEVTKENEFGTHVVRQYGGVHFKYHMVRPPDKFNKDRVPAYPAVEYMVGSIYNRLAGPKYGIAPTEVVKLHRAGYTQIMIASQTVDGMNLQLFFENYVSRHPEYIYKFESYSFSAMVITSLLANLADAKPDNYMVRFTKGTSEDDFRVRIVGIDNDLAFANPIVRKHQGKKAGQHFVDVRNVFYFFSQMQGAIDVNLRQRLVNYSAELLLLNFIKDLQEQNQNYEKLKTDGVLTEKEYKSLCLPILFPRAGSLVSIYRSLVKIKTYLVAHPAATHNELFRHLYPEVFAYYQTIWQECKNAENNILMAIYRIYAAAAPSFEEAKIIVEKNDRSLMSKVAINTMMENIYSGEGQAHNLAGAVAEFIGAIDFHRLGSSEAQRMVIGEIKGLGCIECLIIRNSDGLDDDWLIQLCRALPNLRAVHLIGCPMVSFGGILAATQENKNLRFGISGCKEIRANQYKKIAQSQAVLVLLARDDKGIYHAIDWRQGTANIVLHEMFNQDSTLSLSLEQLKFLISEGLDINSMNYTQTALNGYTALHIAAVNKNLKMLGLLLALGADPQKLDKHSQETPFQKAVKRKLFTPCYALSQASNAILSSKERQNLSDLHAADLSVRKIQSVYRGYMAQKLNFKL